MAVATFQVTLLAGITRVQSGSPQIFCKQIMFQNNATHTMRIGDINTSASQGMLLATGTPGGAMNSGVSAVNYTYLSDWYVFGTVNDVLDVLYII